MTPARVAEDHRRRPARFPRSAVAVLGEGWDFTTFLVDERMGVSIPEAASVGAPTGARTQSARRARHTAGTAIDRNPALPVPRGGTGTVESGVCRVSRFCSGEPLVDCHADSLDSAAIAPSARCIHAASASRDANAKTTHLSRSVPVRPHRLPAELDESSVALPPAIAEAMSDWHSNAHPPSIAKPPRFQHGDLGVEHMLVDRDRSEIVSIIDWGDAGWGNRIADLVGLWAWGGDRAVRAALPEWGQTLASDDWTRLRQWGIAYAIGICLLRIQRRARPVTCDCVRLARTYA